MFVRVALQDIEGCVRIVRTVQLRDDRGHILIVVWIISIVSVRIITISVTSTFVFIITVIPLLIFSAASFDGLPVVPIIPIIGLKTMPVSTIIIYATRWEGGKES